MKTFLITEQERRDILNQHSVINVTKSHYDLYEEKNNILKLMNLNEGIKVPTKLTEIPGFEKLAKILDSQLSEDILKNIGDYSATLKSLGINTVDELIEASRKWQQLEQTELSQLKEGSDLLNAYLKSKGVISEISLNVLKKRTQSLDASARGALDDLNDAIANYTQRSEMDPINDGVINISDDISLDGLSQNKTKLEGLEKKIDESIKKVNDQLSGVRERVNLLPQSQRSAYTSAIETLTKISKSLEKLKLKVGQQKLAIEAAEEQFAYIKTIEGDVIAWEGKVWSASELGTFGKWLIKIGTDSYPFVYAVCTFIRQYTMTQGLSDALFENLAKLQQLQKLLSESAGGTENTIISEINMYSRETSTLITMLNNKKLIIKPNEGKSAGEKFAEIIGYGGTDLANTWKAIVDILDAQVKKGVITNAEMVAILDKIKFAYANVSGKAPNETVTLVGDSPILGIFKFKEDLGTQAKTLGIDLGNTVETAVTKSSSNATTMWEKTKKYIYDNVYKPAAGVTKPMFIKALTGFFIREFIFGLPLNIRYYLKPLSKFGFSLRGVVLTYAKLLMAKFIGDFVIGGISAIAYQMVLAAVLPGTNLTHEEAEQIAWGDFEKDMEKYRNLDISEIATLGGIDDDVIYGERESNNNIKYKQDVSREYGPFKITLWEIWEEVWSYIKTNPSKEQLKKYVKNETDKELSDSEKRLGELKDKAFYTLDPEEQDKLTNIGEWSSILKDDFNGDINKLSTRLFVKAEFSGLPDIDPKISEAQKIKNALTNLDNYGYKVCLCKRELRYEEKQIKVGDQLKTAKIPVCRNFVRLIEYKPRNFADKSELDANPKQTGQLSPLYDKIGYIDGSTALDAAPISSQFHLLDEFKKYLN